MRLDLNLVEVFCHVYEEGSFSRAAQKLHISQSTVSTHIKNLEGYIGTKLFDRLPRRVVPTRAAQLLYQRGRRILQEREAARQDLQRLLDRIEGPLVISGSPIPGEYVLPQVISSFRARYPAVTVELRIADAKIVCDEVLSGAAELGFACLKMENKRLEFRRFASSALALVVPNDKKWRRVKTITLDRLKEESFLIREAGSGMRLAVEQKMGCPLDEFNVVGSFGSNEAVREALREGIGVSVLSLLAVRSELANGEFKTIEIEGADPQPLDLFAVSNKSLTLSPIAEAFLDHSLNISTRQKDSVP